MNAAEGQCVNDFMEECAGRGGRCLLVICVSAVCSPHRLTWPKIHDNNHSLIVCVKKYEFKLMVIRCICSSHFEICLYVTQS